MNIGFDIHNNAEPKKIFLGTPDKKLVCAFNSIKEETVSLRLNLNNTCELNFRMDKYIEIEEQLIEANGYDIVSTFSRIYVEDIGWFICDTPKTENDGYAETKEIMAESIEAEFMQHDLVGLKFNHGTTDSMEMLAEGNVIVDEVGIEFAKHQVKFYNEENPELSLLHIVLRESGLRGWEIGYVDNSPKIYRNYVDGRIVESITRLHDEIGFFHIDSKSVYAFLTQDVAKYFECMVLFDINNFKINVYRVESLGRDTNITIGFRNLEKSNLVEVVNPKSVFTRFRVSGGNNLGITFVNFGSNIIENIDYFLNSKFMPVETIKKYRAWYQDMTEKRLEFISLSRQHNAQLELVSELTNRVPLDDSSRDWSTFPLEDLENRLLDFQAQQRGIESFFTDEHGNLDSVRLENSSLWGKYTQIVNIIIPNIKIAIANKQAQSQDDIQEFVELKDWTLYGLRELQIRIRKFEAERDIYIRNGFNVPWHESSGNTRDMHEFNHRKYIDVTNMLNSNFRGSAAEALMLRQQEVDTAQALLESLATQRRDLIHCVQKENWTHVWYEPFTEDELHILYNGLYNDTDYVNENMFLVSSDTTVTAVDEQLRLLDVAENELVTSSQPQYRYDTTLENFIAMHDYKDFTKHLELGNFINLGVRDDFIVKLRLISIEFNPLVYNNDISLEFSNMVRNASGRNDFASLLETASNTGRNQISGGSGGTGRNEDNLSVRVLMDRLIQAMEFQSAVGNAVNRELGGLVGSLLTIRELEAAMIRTTNIHAENGFFQYLQAQLIAADQIIANSGDFQELTARIANIGTLLSGEVVAGLGHIIRLTAQNVVIDEAVIRELIASQILVSDLRAGEISTNSMNIVSDDGGFKIVGNTMQFFDSSNNLRIQIGRDSSDSFSFTLYDVDGKGILIDQYGIRESAISDGLIRGDMLADRTISRDKLNFNIVEADEDGNIDVSRITVNGQGIEAEFTSIRKRTEELAEKIQQTVELTGVESRIDALESSITNRIWRDDVITIFDEDGNEIEEQSLHSLITQQQMNVGSIQNQVVELGSRLEDGIIEITANMSSLLDQTAEMIATSVVNNITGDNSFVNQRANELSQQISNAQNQLSILSQTATTLSTRLSNNEGDVSELRQTANSLMQRLISTENDIQTVVAQALSASEGWKVSMARIGAYEGDDVPNNAISTTMRIREDGVTINSNDNRQAVRLTGREVAGYFNFDGRHGLLSRNLLLTSGNFQAGTPIKWFARHNSDLEMQVHNGFVRIIKHSATWQDRWIVMPLVDILTTGQHYSFTMRVRRNRTTTGGFTFGFATRHFASTSTFTGFGAGIAANTWHDLTRTLRIVTPGWSYMIIPSSGLANVGDTLDIAFWMFNEGNAVYPPWEPAPEKIFGIDEDIVYSNRLLVDNGIDLVNQKIIPVTFEDVKGLAFVKAGGLS